MASKTRTAKKETSEGANLPPPPAEPRSDRPDEDSAYIPPVCTVAEAARALRVGRSTVYRLVESGEIAVLRIRGAVRIRREVLLAYAEREPAPPAKPEGAPSGKPRACKRPPTQQRGKRPLDWRKYLGLA